MPDPAFRRPELAVLAAVMRLAAVAEIMPRFRKLGPGAIRAKSGPLDLVTDADEAAEAAITAALARAFPGVLVVGEEAAASDPGLIGQLAGAAMAVVLDPIDGTSNFAAGLPLFGVMAAVVERGVTTASVILDPVCDSFSAALLGQGAWEQAADGSTAPLHVADAAPPLSMSGPVSWRFMAPAVREQVLNRLPRFAAVWDHRCAAHEYRALCAGHSHFVVFNKLMPWDHLPGVLLHAEAGGHGAKFDANAYRPGETAGGLICAPDVASWQAVHAALLGP